MIVDHAVPAEGSYARGWRKFLMRLEPPTVRSVIERGYALELSDAGLACSPSISLACGTAHLIFGRPAT